MCTSKTRYRYRIGLLLLIGSGRDLCRIHRHLRICAGLREALKRVPYTEFDSEFSFERIYEEFQNEDTTNLLLAEAFLKSEYGFGEGIKSLLAAMYNLEDKFRQAIDHVEYQTRNFHETLQEEFGEEYEESLFPFSKDPDYNFDELVKLLTDPIRDDINHQEAEMRRNYYESRIAESKLDEEPPSLLELETGFCVVYSESNL